MSKSKVDGKGSIPTHHSRPTHTQHYSAVSSSLDGTGSSYDQSPSVSLDTSSAGERGKGLHVALGSVTEEGVGGVEGGLAKKGGEGGGASNGIGGGHTPSLQKKEVVGIRKNGKHNKVLESALKNSLEGTAISASSSKKKKKKKKKTTTINEGEAERGAKRRLERSDGWSEAKAKALYRLLT